MFFFIIPVRPASYMFVNFLFALIYYFHYMCMVWAIVGYVSSDNVELILSFHARACVFTFIFPTFLPYFPVGRGPLLAYVFSPRKYIAN